jgi:cytoskeletal protein CcmA (bactofilin family)
MPELKPVRTAPGPASIGSSVFIKGDLTAQEDLTVDGRVDGRIDLPGHTLTIGPNAKVNATVAAKMVTVFGTVTGTMTIHEKLEVRNGATIEGEVTCARISIQEGAVFAGKITMPRRSKGNGAATETPVLAAV